MEGDGAWGPAWSGSASSLLLLSASSCPGGSYPAGPLHRPAADPAAELVDVVVVVAAAGPVVVEAFAPVETSDQPFPAGSSSLLAAACSSASSSAAGLAVAVVAVVVVVASFAVAA